MAQSRMHKVVHDPSQTIAYFSKLTIDGELAQPLDEYAALTNPTWKSYSEVCIETYGIDFSHSDVYGVPQSIVLRCTIRCCCGGACHYNEDHNNVGGGAFLKSVQGLVSRHSSSSNAHLKHPPGQEYLESVIDLNTLRPLQKEAAQRVPNPKERAAFTAEIVAETTLFNLSASDIESQLGVSGVDPTGVLSTPGAVALVLAGTSLVPDDYYWVAAFVVLWERALQAGYTKLTKDWPQRPRQQGTMFGPRSSPTSPQATGA